MAKLVAYLTFEGNCEEAMNFYKECLGEKLDLNKVDSKMAQQMGADKEGQIMHAELTNDKIDLMASDRMAPGKMTPGDDVTLCLVCESENEIKDLFNKLSVGGKVSQPLTKEFFGWFGGFTDKFGKHWMLQADVKQ